MRGDRSMATEKKKCRRKKEGKISIIRYWCLGQRRGGESVPGTQAPRHLGTKAPSHAGTQALRHLGIDRDFPFQNALPSIKPNQSISPSVDTPGSTSTSSSLFQSSCCGGKSGTPISRTPPSSQAPFKVLSFFSPHPAWTSFSSTAARGLMRVLEIGSFHHLI